MEEEEYLPLLKNKKTLYMEETDNLLQSRKREMASDLYGIVENLKSKKNITEFIESKIDYLDNTKLFYSDINDNKNSCILFFIIKIIGFFFLTTYLIGIFQLIGIKDSLEEETFDSIIFFFKGNRENNTFTFYQKLYSNNTKKLPGLTLFFIMSFLSEIILKLISFPLITVIMLILNVIIFYFLYNFQFLEGKEINHNYSFLDFFILVLYVLYFNLILGIVSLIPLDIFSAGYYYYEKYLIAKKKSWNNLNNIINDSTNKTNISEDNNDIIEKNNKINIQNNDNINNEKITDFKNSDNIGITKSYYISDNDNIIINNKKENITEYYVRDSSSFFLEVNDLKKENIKEPNNKNEEIGKYNGYYLSYLLSFLTAIVVRLYSFDDKIISEHKFFYINLSIIHFIPIIFSLFFYLIYSLVFKKKSENKYDICITKFCGYLIFKENKAKKNSICCEGCRVGFRKFNALWCPCCNCKCLTCEKCCPFLPLSDCCKVKADLSEMGDRDKSLCICYKLNGKCSWLCEYFSNELIFYCSIFFFIMKLLNFGFNSLLDKHIKELIYDDINNSNSKNRDEILKIHIAYIVGIIYYYLINLLFGIIFYHIFPVKKVDYYGELYMIGMGLVVLIVFESVISCIFSSLVYFKKIEDYKYYLMAFSVSSFEYLKLLIINYISKNSDNRTQLFTYSSFFSLFLLIINLVFTAIEYSVDERISFIFVQFISGLIFSFFGICIFALLIFFIKKNKIKTSEDLDNLIESQKKEKQKLLEERKKLKEQEEKLIKESLEKEINTLKGIFQKAMVGQLLKEKVITDEDARELIKEFDNIEDDK